MMPFAIVNDVTGEWPLGEKACKVWISSDVMCSTASILSLCAISLDKYIRIKDPLQYTQVNIITVAIGEKKRPQFTLYQRFEKLH